MCCIYSYVGKSNFNIFILFPGVPSQSSWTPLFRVTLSVHSKVCKVRLKITTVVNVIEYDILKQI